ncbi:Por secretion system C-terminal sorting domain-containing protein [Lishizhenia tianjinensis]|uniref:Por secretion system C-terminal sorting domain-containing protein n=1 Tax=Lishizhenia tianjinensis TaxID=477690 RepID=A0A1I6YXG2_9FLAO|nr:MbnP family protein [Lishizhenia tianjinensis]SFT54998.1 Por secretion system C-terminal sorting domain-containing protein [Lishizhenia tianjinensis]
MKNLLLFCALVFAGFANAQVDVNLLIHHTFNNQTPVMNTPGLIRNGEEIKFTRIQYYITRISVIHDGNQVTPISDDTVALVNVDHGLNTTIELGEVNATTLEGVKFHIGVYAPVNNENPSLQPAGHPLAPSLPNMHWGWAAGYRFAALEGVAGTNFSQMWQLHGLGNSNYFETDEIMTGSTVINGVQTLEVHADYSGALNGLSVSQGLISHGEIGEAKKMLQNFSTDVFYPSAIASTEKVATPATEIIAFPNPSTDGHVNISSNKEMTTLYIYDAAGTLITESSIENKKEAQIQLENKGVYLLKVMDVDGVLTTRKIVY